MNAIYLDKEVDYLCWNRLYYDYFDKRIYGLASRFSSIKNFMEVSDKYHHTQWLDNKCQIESEIQEVSKKPCAKSSKQQKVSK